MSESKLHEIGSIAPEAIKPIESIDDDRLVHRPVSVAEYHQRFHGTGTPIVIDVGAFECRAGWATETKPNLIFRTYTARHKHRKGKVRDGCLVGHEIYGKDCDRYVYRSPFDGPILVNYDDLMDVIDYIFQELGLGDCTKVDHPIFLTERLCNFNQGRQRTSTLLFDAYRVPMVCYGVDGLWAHYYHQQQKPEIVSPDTALIINVSHETTDIIPVLEGKASFDDVIRMDVGGVTLQALIRKFLQLRYPKHTKLFSERTAGTLSRQYCEFSAANYDYDVHRLFQMPRSSTDPLKYHPQRVVDAVCIQLPFKAGGPRELTQEERNIRQQKRDRNSKRMKALMAKKKADRIAGLKTELAAMQLLVDSREAKMITAQKFFRDIQKGGFETEANFWVVLRGLETKIAIAEDRYVAPAADTRSLEDRAVVMKKTKFKLLDRLPEELTEQERVTRKQQLTLFRMWLVREQQKIQRTKDLAEKKQAEEAEEEERRVNLQGYLAKLHAIRDDILAKKEEQRLALEAQKDSFSRNGSKRAKKRKLRQLTAKAMQHSYSTKKKKNEDGYGDNEGDWDVYRQMSTLENDDESDEDVAELQRVEGLLRQHDPVFEEQELQLQDNEDNKVYEQLMKLNMIGIPTALPEQLQKRLLNDIRSSQARLYVDRIRAPEALYQPLLAGIHQAGLGEQIERVMHRKQQDVKVALARNVYVTGGVSLLPKFLDRLQVELVAACPVDANPVIVQALDPVLDAWNGARLFAITHYEAKSLEKVCITEKEWREYPPDKAGALLKIHSCSNLYIATPRGKKGR